MSDEMAPMLYVQKAQHGYIVSEKFNYRDGPEPIQHAFSSLDEAIRHIRKQFAPPKPKRTPKKRTRK